MPRAKRRAPRGKGRVANLAKKTAAVATAALLAGLAQRKFGSYRRNMNQIYADNRKAGRRRVPTTQSARGRRGKLKKLAKAAFTTAALAATVPLADRLYTPSKPARNYVFRLPHPQLPDEGYSGEGLVSKLAIPAALYAAYKYHAPSRAAMQAGYNALKLVGPAAASAYRGAQGRGIGDRVKQGLKSTAKVLLPLAAMAGAAHYAYNNHAPSHFAMRGARDAYAKGDKSIIEGAKGGWNHAKKFPRGAKLLMEVNKKMGWGLRRGSGIKRGYTTMKRLQSNPRKPRKGMPRMPRKLATISARGRRRKIRGRGAWDDIMTGFSMPFHAIGDIANAAAPMAPLLKFL